MALVAKAVAAAVLAAVILAAAVETPSALSTLAGDGRASRSVAPSLRALASGFQTDIPRTYLNAAKATIPSDASYYIDEGTAVRSGNTGMLPSVKPVTEFWLYPRRPLSSPRAGAWLICYGCDLARWTARLDVAWQWRHGPIVLGRLTS